MISRRMQACLVLTLLSWAMPLCAETPRPHIDALGDSLPEQALHRFGTSRFCTQAEVTSLTLTSDGKLLAAADRLGHVYVWDALTGRQRLQTGAGSGKRVAFSPDGQWLALGDEFPFEVRNLRLNDSPRLQLGAGPRVFAFSPDNKHLATTEMGVSDVILYDLATGTALRRFAGLDGTIDALAFSPDGKHFAAAARRADQEKATSRIAVSGMPSMP